LPVARAPQRGQQLGALEEERPLFLEEEGESLVGGNLGGVGFHL
jgi:hypothetical protein